jgi:hypothetical protein
MKKCVVQDCKNKATAKAKIWQGFFFKRKQGMFCGTYHMCEAHNRSRDGSVDLKQLLRDNLHLKGAV